ncbi:MAG: hypothetical protein FWD34_10295 [Oscillospiraceae bacterium]|nr:hypothetical protein [Oscillospiraceae bacterium]
MNSKISKHDLSTKIINELQTIAFAEGEEVKLNNKLTAIRMLVNYLGIDKTVFEETPGVIIIDDMCSNQPKRIPIKSLNREQRRKLLKQQGGKAALQENPSCEHT